MKIVRDKNAVSYILSGELDNYHIQQIKELCKYDIDLTKFSYSDTVIIFHDNNENKQTVNIKLKDGKNDFYYPTGWTDDGKLNAGCIYSGSQTKTPITK